MELFVEILHRENNLMSKIYIVIFIISSIIIMHALYIKFYIIY